MTLPPEKLGDKGQRFVVYAYGYPNADKNTIGYAEQLPGALAMLKAISLAPGYERGHVYDRETGAGHFLIDRPKK